MVYSSGTWVDSRLGWARHSSASWPAEIRQPQRTEDSMATAPDEGARFQLGDQRRPLHELIEDKLRELIDAGDLKPGDRLPTESDLASQMKVARGSLRSALQRLEVRRVIEVRRGLGWFVRSASSAGHDNLQQLMTEIQPAPQDILAVRLGLESVGASLAAEMVTSEQLLEISLLSDAHRAVEDGNVNELVRTDEAFHAAIMRASGNNLLIVSYEMLVAELAPLRARSYNDADSAPAESANDHDAILYFLQEHDRAGARVSMVNHIMKIYNKTASRPAALRAFG
jgi:GntR family transcriptional repressor for pyruvate dehydrogenase complex